METNFFQQLTAISPGSTNVEWTIVIKQLDADSLIVSVLYKDENCKDPASRLIPPLIFRKSAAFEFDRDFFGSLAENMGTTVKLFCDMQHYAAQQEQALAASKMEKTKTVETEKQKTEKDKKYDAAMKKVDELEAEGKYREAWMKVPEIADYPQHETEIRERKAQLSEQFAPTLFS